MKIKKRNNLIYGGIALAITGVLTAVFWPKKKGSNDNPQKQVSPPSSPFVQSKPFAPTKLKGLGAKRTGVDTPENDDAVFGTPVSETKTGEDYSEAPELQTVDVAYVGAWRDQRCTNPDHIVDSEIMEVRLNGPIPKELSAPGTTVILSGTDGDDGAYDLHQDMRGIAGQGRPGIDPPCRWLFIEHHSAAQKEYRMTPGAKCLI